MRAVSVPPDSNLGVTCIITIFWLLLFCFMMCSAVYLGRLDSTFVEDNAAPRGPSSHFPMSEEGILAKTLCHLRVAVEICDRRNPRFVVTGFHKESGFRSCSSISCNTGKSEHIIGFPAAIYSKSFIGDIQRAVFVPPGTLVFCW